MLSKELWTPQEAYNAGHYLMVPLHHAFKNPGRILSAFENHFARAAEAYRAKDIKIEISGVSEMQYLALASRYLAMNAANPDPRLNEAVAALIEERVTHYWQKLPAWQWGRAPFPGGIRERLEWKLANKPTKPSYYRVIFDQEMYVIGMAADLGVWRAHVGQPCAVCEDALRMFDRIMERELDRSGEGWRFQVGVWADHPDYAHAGYFTVPGENARPVRIASIQEDSSHAHRWPLWLTQVRAHRDVDDLVARLKWQLLNRVVDRHQELGVPVLRNYMSGHNGYYRWLYQKRPNFGYAPYQVSGTFTLGWWSFLGGEEIGSLYEQLSNAFPLNPGQHGLYFTMMADTEKSGLGPALARMAASISRGQGGRK